MKAFIAIIFVISSASAFAGTMHQLTVDSHATISGAPVPIPPAKPPKPIPPPPNAKSPHYGFWKPMWDNGTTITNEYVRGDWIVTGRATNAACAVLYKDGANDKGMKNDDGSDFVSLSFTDFPTDGNKTIFGAQIKGLGGKTHDQGPYELAPQAPQFATWAYNSDLSLSDSYYEFDCRGTSDNKLVCVLSLQNLPADSADEYIRCGQSPQGAILVYSKK